MNAATFITQNLHVAIVIAILLLGLVVRRKGVRKPRQAPMPPFGGGTPPRRRPPDSGRADVPTTSSSPAAGAGSGMPTTTRSSLVAAERAPVEPRPTLARMLEAGSTQRPVDNPSIALAEPDREELVRGIIWSEVLGPPRAKRPYRPK